MNATTIIEILDPQAGKIRETVVEEKPLAPSAGGLMEVSEGKPRQSLRQLYYELKETASTSIFPSLLRDGIKTILYDTYAGVPQTWQLWAKEGPSDKPDETYLEAALLGLPPLVPEGGKYADADMQLDRTVNIRNNKYGFKIGITWEMLYYDRIGMIKQMVEARGRSHAAGKEQRAYNVLTTTGNYVRNSTTGDNDIGANTATTTFSPEGMELAMSTLSSMKDRKSGLYLGVRPSMLICGPRLQFAAKQLLLSPDVTGFGDADATVVYGNGTTNPFRGIVDTIVVSPFVESYGWVLCEPKQAVLLQTVLPLELSQGTMTADNSAWFDSDIVEYKTREVFGVGMLNDRFAFYSNSTTKPTIN